MPNSLAFPWRREPTLCGHPEPRPLGGPAQRLPERPHEARPAQRRHAVEHAQGHQERTAAGNVLPRPVRNPRLPDPWAAAPGRAPPRPDGPNSNVVWRGSWRRFLFTAGVAGRVLRVSDSLRLDTVYVNSIGAVRRSYVGRMKGAMFVCPAGDAAAIRYRRPTANRTPAAARFPRFVHGAGPQSNRRRGGRRVGNAAPTPAS